MREGSRTMPSVHLQARREAPAKARDFIATLLVDAPEEMRARACHVVSELVTNSVRHAGGTEILVDALVGRDEGFDVSVHDQGPGFEAQPKAPGHADTTGWGLIFVDMLSDSWAAGGPSLPVVSVHFEPRSIDEEAPAVDPLLDERLRDLLDVRMLLDSVKDYAIFALNHNGDVTMWNAGAERLTGYSMGDVLGSSVNLLHSDSEVVTELPAALAHGRH